MNGLNIRVITCILLAVVLAGCSATSAEYGTKGAATGAVSASFVGAMTDLIVDGRVDSYRLKRNVVGGAVAGGTAGAVVGYKKDKAAEKDQKPATQPVQNDKAAALKRKIGEKNYAGLEMLVRCQHADAFRVGQETAGSNNMGQREAGLILQAMVDHDRGNDAGLEVSLQEIVREVDQVNDIAEARKGLADLQQKLVQERRAQGLNSVCN